MGHVILVGRTLAVVVDFDGSCSGRSVGELAGQHSVFLGQHDGCVVILDGCRMVCWLWNVGARVSWNS